MENELSLDDWLDDDEVINTDDPDFEYSSGDPDTMYGDGNNNPPDYSDDSPSNGDDVDNGGTAPEVTEFSGDVVEKFLERYGVIGGNLITDKGEKRFSELTSEQQLKALEQVVDSTRPTIEEDLGLNDEETSLLNFIRQSKMSVQDFMIKSAQEYSENTKVSETFDAPEYRFEDMDKDVIYATYIRALTPDISDEDLISDLEHAKNSAIYDKTVENLRGNFISNREAQKEQHASTLAQERVKVAQATIKPIVDAAQGITEISGWPISDDIKNDLLGHMVEFDAAGKSDFIKSVVESPENAFKAMWYIKNGDKAFSDLDNYYKSKMQEIYAKGIEEGASGKGDRRNAIKIKENNKSNIKYTSNVVDMDDFLNS